MNRMVTIFGKEPQHLLFLPYDWHYIMNFTKCQQIFETNFIFFVHIKFILTTTDERDGVSIIFWPNLARGYCK